MKKITRRELLRLGLSGAALALLSRCVPKSEEVVAPTVEPTSVPVDPTPRPSPTAGPGPRLLRNENRHGFYIRYYQPFAPVDRATWRLQVEGLVARPQSLSFEALQELPSASQKSRMKCVEGWSAAAKWEGFRMAALVDLVDPDPAATWVHFYSADDYYESLPLEELLHERVLFVYKMNDALLLDEYGAPLRLIVPFKYGYKGPKAIVRVVFSDEPLRGFWPSVGPYTMEGDIAPGRDYALDLDADRDHGPGEVFYPDGLESS